MKKYDAISLMIVIANPNVESFSHEILKTLIARLDEHDYKYIVVDLYRSKDQQKFYTHAKSVSVMRFQKEIREADGLIFIHPIYWCTSPAILKNFLEQNFREDFAYRYKSDNPYEPLLSKKNIRLIVTSNESEKVYQEIGMPFKVA